MVTIVVKVFDIEKNERRLRRALTVMISTRWLYKGGEAHQKKFRSLKTINRKFSFKSEGLLYKFSFRNFSSMRVCGGCYEDPLP